MFPIEFLHGSERAEIAEVDGEPTFVSRMSELGLRVGSSVRMIQPGYPCLVEVDESRLSLRLGKSAQVLVKPVPLR